MANIIIVGATGAVGLELINLIEKRHLVYNKLKLLASKRSINKQFVVNNKTIFVEELTENSFVGFHYAIFATNCDISKQYIPYAIQEGCTAIDNSSAYRMQTSVPLIIPEINLVSKSQLNSKIIANPNCSTIILLVVLYPLYKQNKIKQIDVTTYQASSGAGLEGMKELENQTKAYHNNETIETPIFQRPYLFNVFSHNSPIDRETGFNEEELKMIHETHKILSDNDIHINPTCIRVPTLRSHLEVVHIQFENETNVDTLRNIILNAHGVTLYEDYENNRFPEPILTSHKNDVYVGRIRQSYHGDKKNFQLILSGDQLLKGASLNAIQILESLL